MPKQKHGEPQMERATLGVDGDHAFALLGENIQEGDAEFVKVENDDPWHTSAKHRAERQAAREALARLRKRLGKPHLSYEIGPSHPDHC